MKRKKIILYTILTLIVLGGAAAFYIYKEYNRTHLDTADLTPDFSVQPEGILKEFADNEQLSNKKYWDKVIKVEGLVKEITKDEKGFYSIALGDSASMSSVRCSIDSAHGQEAASLMKGKPVVIKGICSGYTADELLGSDIVLIRSVVEKEN